jgi:hypothetical protein
MTVEEIIALVERALRAEIGQADAERLWPSTPKDPYLAQVRDDLIFATQHIPGSGTDTWVPDLVRWQRMPEYDDLCLHIENLRQRLPGPS